MKSLRTIVRWLRGKKTYLTAVGLATYAIFVLGVDEGDWNTAWERLLEAAAIAGLRAGISKN